MESNILRGAEAVFASSGYKGGDNGVPMQHSDGLSKQNLLYYFSSEELLYRTVLQNIVDIWLEGMVILPKIHVLPPRTNHCRLYS
ncbi:hypothetical protein P4S72_08075 [Vibrio sp. PP-XX7]